VKPLLQRLFREPLVHFVVIGGLLFAGYAALNGVGEPPADVIIITLPRIDQLSAEYEAVWRRQPTEDELGALIEEDIREEVYYREAMAMGLDRDDTIVRRRMRQKLEFVTDDLVAAIVPTDEQLGTYFSEHPDDFRVPPRVSFQQIYFSRDRRGEQVASDAISLLARLSAAGSAIDPLDAGDSLMLPGSFDDIFENDVARHFGTEFAAALVDVPVGRWSGPLESAYGLHLVWIRERHPSVLPPLQKVRARVERDWESVRRKEATEAFYNGLRQRYEVSVERPGEDATEEDAKVAEDRR